MVSPLGDASRMNPQPPVLTVNVLTAEGTSASSVVTDMSSSRKSQQLVEDDDEFINIAAALLEKYAVKKLTMQQAIDETLLPHERKSFLDALHFRKSRLPIYAEVSEHPSNRIVRKVDKTFGSTLRRMCSPKQATSASLDSHIGESRSPRSTFLDSTSTQQVRTPSDAEAVIPPLPSVVSVALPPSTPPSENRSQSVETSPRSFHFSSHRDNEDFVTDFATDFVRPSHFRYRDDAARLRSHGEGSVSSRPYYFPRYPNNGERYHAPENISMDRPYHTAKDFSPDYPIQNLDSMTSSVDTQRIGNTQPQARSYYHPEMEPVLETQYHLMQGSSRHQQQSTHDPSHYQKLSPSYKRYRPPNLHISSSPVQPVMQSPQIDIDWNLPIVVDGEKEKKEGTIQKITCENRVESSVQDMEADTSIDKKSPFKSGEEGEKLGNMGVQVLDTQKSPDCAPANTSDPVKGTQEVGESEPTNQGKDATAIPEDAKSKSSHRAPDFRLDIARKKSALILDGALTMNKQLQLRKQLIEEIDRVDGILDSFISAEERTAYEAYLNELRVELEKWNNASEFGSQHRGSNASTSRPREIEFRTMSTWESAKSNTAKEQSPKAVTVNKTEEMKMDTIIPQSLVTPKRQARVIKGSDQFPDVRKQWRMVDVEAPSNLPEGFQFEARIGDQVFMATVPKGGASKGEIFATLMGDIRGDSTCSPDRMRVFKDMEAPPSRWRDELFDCFRYGVFHSSLWASFFCPHIALSQVMARVQVTDTGEPHYSIKSRPKVCWYAVFSLFVIGIHVLYCAYFVVAEPDRDTLLIATCPLAGLDVLLYLYFLYMVVKTRRTVRHEFDIPELRCRGHEDCCMALFCSHYAIAQMMRHTADYETYQAYCCTDTGLAKHIEVKLPYDYLPDDSEGERKSNAVDWYRHGDKYQMR